MTKPLSSSLEDYLEAIAELIAVDGHAHTKEIADKLNVKMPSVTGALRQLEQLGFIVYNAHYPVQLTAAGAEIAAKVLHRHNVLKSFFADIMGLSAARASETACHIEHVVDAETIRRFVLFSNAISTRRDAGRLQTFLTEAMAEENRDLAVLADLPAGSRGVFLKKGRNIPENTPVPIPAGTGFTVCSFSLDKSYVRISAGGSETEVAMEIAENMWCRPVS